MRILPLFSIILLSGCSEWLTPEKAVFQKYHQRLATVLEVSASTIEESAAVTIPDKRVLFHDLPRVSLGLLESYQLRQCGLFNLIAQKNSPLGKVQDSFYDFDYQTSLLRTLHGCLTHHALSKEDQSELNDVYTQKWEHFPTHLDNLLLTSDAMRKQLTASQWLSINAKAQVVSVRSAFLTLEEMYLTPPMVVSRLPDVALVNYQEEIEKTRLIGRLYYTLTNVSLWLKQTTEMLKTNQDKIVCGKNRDTTTLRYLRNVFQSVYVKQVQPYMAYLDSTYQQLDSGIRLVEVRMKAHGHDYGMTSMHQEFRNQTLEHVQFWQQLFKRCGVRIGDR
ncbi:DUF3080 domain-containing protein [Vibrio sp. PNB22_3_1]|uniref:DUF3080 domain-containing protein n=1 Tax=unclassified Vibrio TaxID=2614977 RepID=UPI00406A1E8F